MSVLRAAVKHSYQWLAQLASNAFLYTIFGQRSEDHVCVVFFLWVGEWLSVGWGGGGVGWGGLTPGPSHSLWWPPNPARPHLHPHPTHPLDKVVHSLALGQTHLEPSQIRPGEHSLPHPPQLYLSVMNEDVLKQLLPREQRVYSEVLPEMS